MSEKNIVEKDPIKVPSGNTLAPKSKKGWSPEPEREIVRKNIAYGAAGLLCITVIGTGIVDAMGIKLEHDLLTPVFTITGTILAFYFGQSAPK